MQHRLILKSTRMNTVFSIQLSPFRNQIRRCSTTNESNTTFADRPKTFWSSMENQKLFLNQLAKDHNITTPEDWYKITSDDIQKLGGTALLKLYDNSPSKIVEKNFPETNWLPWKFQNPKTIWKDMQFQKKFMQWAANELNIKEPSDWYNLTELEFSKVGGSQLLSTYKNSISTMVTSILPELNLLPWKFNNTPEKAWKDHKLQRNFIEWASKELKIQDIEDWYKVTVEDFKNIGGTSILAQYDNSLSTMLSSVLKELPWQLWKFQTSPKGYWTDVKNQQAFMEWAAEKLGIKEPEQWYSVDVDELAKLGGTVLVSNYGGSSSMLVSSIFPDYPWLPWKFTDSPFTHWGTILKNEIVQKEYVQYLIKELKIDTTEDWYNKMTREVWEDLNKPPIRMNEVMELVKDYAYPDIDVNKFQEEAFQLRYSTLFDYLKQLFPEEEIVENYENENLKTALGPILFDVGLPQLKLVFLSQGHQHLNLSLKNPKFVPLEKIFKAEEEKLSVCKQNNFTLIRVPRSWDLKPSDLVGAIAQHRKDLIDRLDVNRIKSKTLTAKPVVESEKPQVDETVRDIMSYPSNWNADDDPTGWMIGERYEGVRGFWRQNAMYTIRGKILTPPPNFTQDMPNIDLDGELWLDYGAEISKKFSDWRNITFWVYDSPMQGKNYEERYQALQEMQQSFPPHVKLVKMTKCASKEEMMQLYEEVLKKKGDGVVLMDPKGEIKPGKSEAWKQYKPHAEVKVLQNNYPHGLMCLQITGETLFVGVTDNFKEAKEIKSGQVISVKHSGVNAYGKLLQPIFNRLRNDVSWEELIEINKS